MVGVQALLTDGPLKGRLIDVAQASRVSSPNLLRELGDLRN